MGRQIPDFTTGMDSLALAGFIDVVGTGYLRIGTIDQVVAKACFVQCLLWKPRTCLLEEDCQIRAQAVLVFASPFIEMTWWLLKALKTFDANDLYQGQNFSKVLSSLVALNKVTAGSSAKSQTIYLEFFREKRAIEIAHSVVAVSAMMTILSHRYSFKTWLQKSCLDFIGFDLFQLLRLEPGSAVKIQNGSSF
ncbi:hypothetical protein llap_7167 [Limosa lapponica baueri]|uniref:Uncharacterized protein n=1 Tax=Limosa lapponica baueri TaxID=1758121 RepID=A0A2I0U8Z4_LIMLA|nr:hypothetical protein llap_7167 [Limosa lapponica baueri]